jgi:hypothetical protein
MLMYQLQSGTSYASMKNAQYTKGANNAIKLKQRWDDTFNSLPAHVQNTISQTLSQLVVEFKRRHPNIQKWEDLCLAQSVEMPLDDIWIDDTMQRRLSIFWVLEILSGFSSVKVVPIQVYREPDGKIMAWDGQHTAILLWVICTQVLGLDPKNVKVPVNIYHSSKKSEMRDNFITLNGVGKKPLDLIDIWEQMIYGVRVDNSQNPAWVAAELKQRHVEKWDLFVTDKKFNDHTLPGAISRLQEINKLPVDTVGHLMHYLGLVTRGQRPVAEKEIVMMSFFFDRCRLARINVDEDYIKELAVVADTLWDADFTPTGKFWAKAGIAYSNWHSENVYDALAARFNKEPPHGMPFLLAQLSKSFSRPIPANTSNSPFIPAASDLF